MRKPAPTRLLVLTVAAGLLLAACGRTPPPATKKGLSVTPATVTAQANDTVQFEFEAHGLPAGTGTVTFVWNFGDGGIGSTGSEEVKVSGTSASHSLSYTYARDGAFGVFVSVQDPAGEELFTGHGQAVIGDVSGQEREYELNVCDVWRPADAGGHGITMDIWDLSGIPAGASISMRFDALNQPDRYLIEYPVGTLVHDTGWRGSSFFEGDPLYPGGIAGPGIGEVVNMFKKGASDTFKITIIGGEPGTVWYYDFRCDAN